VEVLQKDLPFPLLLLKICGIDEKNRQVKLIYDDVKKEIIVRKA
jgi:hypothetical protein